ncbi:cholinesterase [Diplogelasinospora grovesii]|uniref:Carboxylic ester hydrolase n=1 Tax=Diplogelasinospora grovesii TaxID=303347 RepID=A0AAN6N4C0_9PEZI|nr:cholinesterase [Diplogelasinospora grovesii]
MKPIPLIFVISLAVATPMRRDATPTVTIDNPDATIFGSSFFSVDTFNGIPFAQPPTGALRLKPPLALTSSLGTVKAVGIPRACPQFIAEVDISSVTKGAVGLLLDSPFFQAATDSGEDCLTLNIQRTAGTTSSSKLPVLFWIFGGGFELGSTQTYDAASLVIKSAAQGKPIIVVAVNYRVGAFGFLPGADVLEDASSNLGLLDQRMGLQWVADNIAAFGGDPDKVTIWGESAGAISVFDQMALYDGNMTYKGKPLFRAAIMNSGSIAPVDPVDSPKAELVYQTVLANAGCSSAPEPLQCLRDLDYNTFLNAANSVPAIFSYHSVSLSYLPRPDGVVLTDSPERLVKAGKYARVPFIVGDQEDEGTAFALFQANITTTDELVAYLSEVFFHDATVDQLTALVATYPDNAAAGSPFRTSSLNEWYPQYKRLAAILGDLVFTLARRVFLDLAHSANSDIPSWSYLASYGHDIPILGTFHGSDLLQVFYGIPPNYAASAIISYYLSFIYDLDPDNGTSYMPWPQWATDRKLMNFQATSTNLLIDDFRSESYEWIAENARSLHL